MAGHSKWANIKRQKGVKDAQKSKLYTRLVKEIVVAIKQGGPIVETNSRLKIAIQNAKAANLPKATIEKTINKANSKDQINYTEISYEGYAKHGVAIIVECTTDNTNRTVSEVRTIFNKYGGSMAKNGSIAFLFERKGKFVIEKNENEELVLQLIDAGAETVDTEDDNTYILSPMQHFHSINKLLEECNISIQEANLEYIPNKTVKITEEQAEPIIKLIDALENNEDIKAVYHNAEIC
jgi:YebC/PmpR family DNA-binding regulatory protein